LLREVLVSPMRLRLRAGIITLKGKPRSDAYWTL